jgi:tetratricopeptide (TPR) repeat protein
MNIKVLFSVALLSVILLGCSTTGMLYNVNMYEGKKMLKRNHSQEALEHFTLATQISPDADAYSYAAIAAFKIGYLDLAAQYLKEAEKSSGRSFAYLRIVGYKALIALKPGTTKAGLDALYDYIEVYRHSDPLINIEDVEDMWHSGKIDFPVLEKLIAEQITTYDNDIEDFLNNRGGWYEQKYRSRMLGY